MDLNHASPGSSARPFHSKAPLWQGAMALVFGLLIAGVIAVKIERNNARVQQEALAQASQKAIRDILDKIRYYEFGLRGARGSIVTLGPEAIRRDRFKAYALSRSLASEFPGARGFGFIRKVLRADEAAFIQAARHDGWPDFSIRQLTPHDGDRYVIQYIEPVDRNIPAVGLDIASEANRLQAADAAMRSGAVQLTGPITLVQATGDKQQAFLILLPIYRGIVTPASEEDRLADLFGWSYAPLNMNEVLADFRLYPQPFHMELSDVTLPEKPEVFFSTESGDHRHDDTLIFSAEQEVYGRRWAFRIAALPVFVESLNQVKPSFAFLVGSLISLAISVATGAMGVNRARKKQIAAAQSRLAAIVENSSDAIVGESLEGKVISWNRAAEDLFGYPGSEIIGHSFTATFLPDDRQEMDRALMVRIASGADKAQSMDARYKRRDQGQVDVLLTASVIYDADGKAFGIARLIRDISERKAHERRIEEFNAQLERQVAERTDELATAQRTLQAVLDAVPSMIGYWDRNLVCRFANHAYSQWFKVDHRALPGRSLQSLLGKETFEAALPYIQGALSGQRQTFERAVPRPSALGGVRHSLVHYIPETLDGEVMGFYVLAHDVSDIVESRQKLTLALRENEALLRTINQQMLYSATDTQGRIIEVNDNFCKALGYERDELLGKTHHRVSSGVHPAAFWKDVWSEIAAGKSWRGEVCNRAKDGSLRWLDSVFVPFISEGGIIERYIALRIDITDRKLAEAERNRTAALLNNVLSSASEFSVIATDTNGLITIFNKGAERMLGYQAEEMVHRQTPAVIHRADEVEERSRALSGQYGQAIEGFRVFVHVPELEGYENREWTYVHRDGRHIPVSLVVTTIKDDRGVMIGYLGIAQDIGPRKEFERQLLRAKQAAEEASLAKGQFLANMSHEIRTPMNAVLGMLALAQKTGLDPYQRDYIDKAHSAARSLLGLLNDILDFSKIEAGQLQLDLHPFDLERLMRDLATILSGAQGKSDVEVMFDFSPNLPAHVIGDSLRLKQILINLAGNALKFTHSGQVVVSFEELRRSQDAIEVRISVTDTGIGIAPDQIEPIFELFRQAEASMARKFGGTGLGLAITRRLVGLMGGVLNVRSRLGKGSQFWFDIPLQLAPTPSSAPILSKPIHVLIVDDNETSAAILKAAAHCFDWKADAAASGIEAIGLVETAARQGFAYDVILMDWQMPGLDGLQSAQAIQNLGLGSHPLVIMVTAHGRETLVAAAKQGQAPFDAILSKPITPGQLAEAVRDALEGKDKDKSDSVGSGVENLTKKDRLAGMRLLIVEDNALNRQVAEELLKGEGAIVSLASGGLEGVDMACAFSHDNGCCGPYDVILMDMQMPDIDGLEATRRIRAHERTVGSVSPLSIIAMTANVAEADRLMCLAAGMNGHLGKPIDLDATVKTLRAAKETSGSQGEAAARSISPETPLAAQADAPPALVEPLSSILMRFGGNKGLLAKLVPSFTEQAHALIDTAENAAMQGDQAATLAALHNLKGAARSIGATGLGQSAADWEERLKNDASGAVCADLAVMIALMRPVLVSSMQALSAYIDERNQKQTVLVPLTDPSSDEAAWKQSLLELTPLLEQGNLEALDKMESLVARAPDAYRALAHRLLGQIETLDFMKAVSEIRQII
jgi:PAS domain S-box-containing protein